MFVIIGVTIILAIMISGYKLDNLEIAEISKAYSNVYDAPEKDDGLELHIDIKGGQELKNATTGEVFTKFIKGSHNTPVLINIKNTRSSPFQFSSLTQAFKVLDSQGIEVWNLEVQHYMKGPHTIQSGQTYVGGLPWPLTIRPNGDYSQIPITAPPGKYSVAVYSEMQTADGSVLVLSDETIIVVGSVDKR